RADRDATDGLSPRSLPYILIVFRNDETVVERVEGEDLGCGPPARLEEALHVVDPRRVGARARHAAVECELLTGGEGGGGVVDPDVPPRLTLGPGVLGTRRMEERAPSHPSRSRT